MLQDWMVTTLDALMGRQTLPYRLTSYLTRKRARTRICRSASDVHSSAPTIQGLWRAGVLQLVHLLERKRRMQKQKTAEMLLRALE